MVNHKRKTEVDRLIGKQLAWAEQGESGDGRNRICLYSSDISIYHPSLSLLDEGNDGVYWLPLSLKMIETHKVVFFFLFF